MRCRALLKRGGLRTTWCTYTVTCGWGIRFWPCCFETAQCRLREWPRVLPERNRHGTHCMFLVAIKVKVSFDSDARAARPSALTPGVNQRCTFPVVALPLPARRRLADRANLLSIDMGGNYRESAAASQSCESDDAKLLCVLSNVILNLHATVYSFTCLTVCHPIQYSVRKRTAEHDGCFTKTLYELHLPHTNISISLSNAVCDTPTNPSKVLGFTSTF